jgi:hypothetical protein
LNVLFPIVSFAFIAVLATAPVYGQDNPFTVGSPNSPFGDYSGCQPNCQSNSTLQIRSDTYWSGTYGESTGSTTVDGHGNKDINFCSNTYSAVFQKKGQGHGFLTLNIVQPVSHIVNKPRAIITNGVPIEPGGSVKVSKQITESDFIDFSINQVSNSSSSAVETNQPFNSTLREIITDPNGRIISSNDTDPQTVNFFPMSERGGPKSDIPGKYTFTVKNIGDSPVNVRIEYGLLPPLSPPTITTHNVTNSRTTTAQFGTVSISGSC